jgi:DNA-3-methyladenine glycosylase II
VCSSTSTQSNINLLPIAERELCSRDKVLRTIILGSDERWPMTSDSNFIWGLIRTVIAQQISTKAARTLQERVAKLYPEIVGGSPSSRIDIRALRACGLSPRKAKCCARLATSAETMLESVKEGRGWEQILPPIPGVGPWTVMIFRMLVIREPDLIPPKDLGLDRAIAMHYPSGSKLETISENWKPYRTAACWHLWRSLGNPPLG